MNEVYVDWDGENVFSHFDKPTGSWIFIAIHSSVLGPATGGTRMMHYAYETDALDDCLQLARGMTMKFALAEFQRGGGKAVIAIPQELKPAQKKGLLLRYGNLLKELGGIFWTGPDVGTSSAEMDIISRNANPFVFCRSEKKGGAGSSAELTAFGVFAGITAAVELLFGASSLRDKTILVQGVGGVGEKLIELLLAQKVRVLFNDVSIETIRKFSQNENLQYVPCDEVYNTSCDIFSPCALGGILNEATLPVLNCKAIVGAANNQLANPEIARMLKERNILYAPDFAVNSGGAVGITGIEALGWSHFEAKQEVGKIKNVIQQIFFNSLQTRFTTVEIAEQIAMQNIKHHL